MYHHLQAVCERDHAGQLLGKADNEFQRHSLFPVVFHFSWSLMTAFEPHQVSSHTDVGIRLSVNMLESWYIRVWLQGSAVESC